MCRRLRGVDLDVPPGEFLSIVGPSGSGKSTLFHIIGGLTPPTAGRVSIGGQDISPLTDAGRTELRKNKVGFVFQKFNLLPNLTAGDNIAIARYIAGQRSARPTHEFRRGAEAAGTFRRPSESQARAHFPEASSSAWPSRAPSSIIRPSCWPTSRPAISIPRTPTRCWTLLRDLNQRLGQTILMITHNPEAAAFAHRTVHMRDGRIVA